MFIDPAIRDFVLLPIFALVAVVVYSRNYLIRLISSPTEPDADELVQKGVVARSARLRQHGLYISPQGFYMRKEYLGGDCSAPAAGTPGPGKMQADIKDGSPMGAAGGNPMAMLEPMKQQLVFMGSQIGIGMLINQYLTGFITLKLPFSLTERFKPVTQSGIAAPGLSSSFVSASSWYYILVFGLPPLFRLFSGARGGGDGSMDEARLMQMQMGMGMMGPGAAAGPWMVKTAYTGELGALKTCEWQAGRSPLMNSESDLLGEAKAARAKA